ncbi:hypothetical protein [Streptomyces collinus]
MTWLDVAVGFLELVEAVAATGDVWGPALLGAGLAVGGWRIRPRDGRHRMPSAGWTRVRTVAGTVRAVPSARVHERADGRPLCVGVMPVTCADGRPVPSADGRPLSGGREDGGA